MNGNIAAVHVVSSLGGSSFVNSNDYYAFIDFTTASRPVVKTTFNLMGIGVYQRAGRATISNGEIIMPLGYKYSDLGERQSLGIGILDCSIRADNGKVTFYDVAGNKVTLSSRNAQTVIVLSGFGQGTNESIEVLPNANGKGNVSISSRTPVDIGEIVVNGTLASFAATRANLLGNMTVTGGLGKLTLLDMPDSASGHVIDIGESGMDRVATSLSIKVGHVAGLLLNSDTPIKSLYMTDYVCGSAGAVVITPWIGSITTRGLRGVYNGDFDADLTLSGVGAPKDVALGKVKLAGGLNEAHWGIQSGSIGTITVSGKVLDSRVESACGIKSLTLGAVSGSDFLAGLDVPIGQRCATDKGDYVDSLATIKSINVKGLRLPKGAPMEYFVEDSNFSAGIIGSVKMTNVDLSNGGIPFGLHIYNAGTGKEIKSVSCNNAKMDGTKWTWKPASGEFAYPDMVVEMI